MAALSLFALLGPLLLLASLADARARSCTPLAICSCDWKDVYYKIPADADEGTPLTELDESGKQNPPGSLSGCKALCKANHGCVGVSFKEKDQRPAYCLEHRIVPSKLKVHGESNVYSGCMRAACDWKDYPGKVAPHEYRKHFLYNVQASGWAIVPESFEDCKKLCKKHWWCVGVAYKKNPNIGVYIGYCGGLKEVPTVLHSARTLPDDYAYSGCLQDS